MALGKKLVSAVKQAQKQAEATVAEVRGVLDARLSDANVDPVPFYAVIGAANRAVDTIKHAGEQLEAVRKQANAADLREGARNEAAELQRELQKRIADLQIRAAEMQKIAGQLAEKVLARAQDLPAQVMNQGLVLASNAKDQYDAAADRGERVVSEMRSHADQATDEAAAAAEALATPPTSEAVPAPTGRAVPTPPSETTVAPTGGAVPAPTGEAIATPTGEVPATVVDADDDLTQTVAEAVQDEAEELKEQLQGSASALDEAASPEAPAAKKAPAKKATPRTVKAATKKSAATKSTAAKSTAKKSTTK
ncbi:MAG: hypothetical protein ACTHJJ_10735 [Intrasporangium sp.]|uniref:hypothetical protein n=1 Tax=Intrasporangium sp. TaxID=1925024 RepID=UPI003F817A40